MAILDVIAILAVLLFSYFVLKPVIKSHFAEKAKETERRANAEAIAMNHAYEAMKAGTPQRIEVCLKLHENDLPRAMQELLRERLIDQVQSEDFDRRMKNG